MCRRNSPEKKKKQTNTGYVRETSQVKKRPQNKKTNPPPPPPKKKKRRQHGICKTTTWITRSQYRVCKRNSPHINEGRLGCGTKPPRLNIKPAQHV